MVGRSGDVSLSRCYNIRMENVQGNNRSYYIVIKIIYRYKTGTYRELCTYTEKYFLFYNWYCFMTYNCVMERTNKTLIFQKFSSSVFNSGEARIYSKVFHIFFKVYERFYEIIKQYITND